MGLEKRKNISLSVLNQDQPPTRLARKQVQICSDDDICLEKPILPDFEISVNNIV